MMRGWYHLLQHWWLGSKKPPSTSIFIGSLKYQNHCTKIECAKNVRKLCFSFGNHSCILSHNLWPYFCNMSAKTCKKIKLCKNLAPLRMALSLHAPPPTPPCSFLVSHTGDQVPLPPPSSAHISLSHHCESIYDD